MVVVDKILVDFKEMKDFGVVSTDEEADIFCMRTQEWIHTYGGCHNEIAIQSAKLTQTLFQTDVQSAIKPLFDQKKYFG
jgi:hypothetical protein